MVIKNVIFLILTVLPGLLVAQISDDGGLGNPVTLVPLTVTEIRRIMPIEMQGSWDARNHHTLVRVEGLTTLEGKISFDLFYEDENGYTNTYCADVTLEGEDALNITFNGTLPDVNINKTLLSAFKLRPTLEALWHGKFIIPDLKARVAVIENNYVRVTPGDLGNVTDGKITCETGNSPCYFREDLFTFPPKIKRCKTLSKNDAELLYCDETVSVSTFLSENPTLLLLDDSNLNLGYSEINSTFEVLTIDPEGKLLSQDKPYICEPTETSGSGCAMEVNIPVGTELVNFTVVSIDELGYLDGSTSYPFNIFEVNTTQLTEDAVMTNWIPINENKFDVFIMSNLNLDEIEFKSNLTCESIVDCEYFFTGMTEDGGYIAVVQMQEVNNAIGKTIQGGASEQSKISKISKTTESGEIVTTFTVEETTTIPSSAKLVEVTISDNIVSNKLCNGRVDVVTGGYTFTCPEDIESLEMERNFLLIGYSDSIPKAGSAYINCSEFDVQLDWMGDSTVLREVVNDDRNMTIGIEACSMDKNPCYFSASTSQTEPVSLCTQITNNAPIGNIIDNCEDQKPKVPPALTEKPTLLLVDDTHLNLRYSESSDKIEVLVLDNEGTLLYDNPIDCAPSGINGNRCALEVNIPEGTDTVNFIVVSTDESNIVKGSTSYPFDIFEVNTTQLTEDAVMTNWIPINENRFDVFIMSNPNLDDFEFKSSLTCESIVDCEYFFTGVTEDGGYIAVVQVQEVNNAIGKTIQGRASAQSTISKISKTNESGKIVTNIIVNSTLPTSAKLMEITTSDKEVLDTLYAGDVSEITDGYKFTCLEDIGSLENERKFLLVAYSNDNDIQETGAAYINYKFNVQLDWMPISGILREAVKDDKNITIGEETCSQDKSPCYFAASTGQTDTVSLCTQIKNNAPIGNDIDHCDYQEPKIPPELQLTKIQLQEGEPETNLTVTAPYLSATENVELILFTTEKLLNQSNCTLEPKEDANSTCIANDVTLPSSTTALRVLVVGSSDGIDVTETTMREIEHLEFITKKLSPGSLMVYWTAANPEEYVATLLVDEGETLANMNDGTGEITSADIICDTESSCYASFQGLTPAEKYRISVHKKGDAISATEQDIGVLDQLPDPEGEVIQINKVTRVDDQTTKVSVNESITPPMQIFVALKDAEEHIEESGKGEQVDDTGTVFKFTHTTTIFDNPKDAIFTVLAYDKNFSITKRATADLQLQTLDARVAWVGAIQGTVGSSLRVDTGGQPSVIVGDKRCLKENSPCYFIEDDTIPKNIDFCIDCSNNVEQCDEEVTSYNKLSGVQMSLDGSQLKVTAPKDDPDAKLEVKIYDPENTSFIFSTGNTTCTPNVESNEGSIQCRQPMQIPNDRRPVNVIVSEIDSKGVVTKSSLSNFPFPPTGVESWVITVSVLGSICGASILAYIAVVVIKKKRAHKWQSDAVEKELDSISQISQGHLVSGQAGPIHKSPPQSRDNNSERELSRHDEESRPYSRNGDSPKPPMKYPIRRSPPQSRDNNSERELSRHDEESRPYSRNWDSPKPPMEYPIRRSPPQSRDNNSERELSRHDEESRPYSRNWNSPKPPMKCAKMSRKSPPAYPRNHNSNYPSGYDNKGYASSLYSEGATGMLPKVLPRISIAPNRPASSSSLYQTTSNL